MALDCGRRRQRRSRFSTSASGFAIFLVTFGETRKIISNLGLKVSMDYLLELKNKQLTYLVYNPLVSRNSEKTNVVERKQ